MDTSMKQRIVKDVVLYAENGWKWSEIINEIAKDYSVIVSASTLRRWLNDELFDEQFSTKEIV